MTLWKIITHREFEKKFSGKGKRHKRLFLISLLKDLIRSKNIECISDWCIEKTKMHIEDINSDWFVHDLEPALKRKLFKEIYSNIVGQLIYQNAQIEFREALDEELKKLTVEEIAAGKMSESILFSDHYLIVLEKYGNIFNVSKSKRTNLLEQYPKKGIMFLNDIKPYSFGDMLKCNGKFFYENKFYRFPLFFMKKI